MEATKSLNGSCLISIVIICILIYNIPLAMTRPQDGIPSKERFCNMSEEQQVTCQKCAKITKSPLVYPMCCNDEDGVYSWCTEYVYFGHGKTSDKPSHR